MRSQVYSLLVDNNPGVLSRIAGLFSRRGYSIDSITAGMTADPRFTRITVVSSGDELILSQIEKQLRKLEDVVDIKMLKENPGLDVGLHLVITSEWENVKWRPLTHCPSLTDENGYFYPMMSPNPPIRDSPSWSRNGTSRR